MGVLEPGWTRLYVLRYFDRNGQGNGARLWIFEPAPGEQSTWRCRDFYVRGAARVVEKEDNPRRAHERFEAAPKPPSLVSMKDPVLGTLFVSIADERCTGIEQSGC